MTILSKLNKNELLKILIYYDKYIQYANESNLYQDGWFPVCISEFYENDLDEWRYINENK